MNIDWKMKNILKIGNEIINVDDIPPEDIKKLREKIEPWLTAVFQSEHLSLLTGTGLTLAISNIAKIESQAMGRIELDGELNQKIKTKADEEAKAMGRGEANIEDDFRVAIEFYKGLSVIKSEKAETIKSKLNEEFSGFIENILKTENEFIKCENMGIALSYLKSFLISFSSRTASRDRLNIFTTNYDRFIEYAADMAGILILDRFIGKISPVFRTSKLELDFHYNPPGIRGEPRYVEGVIRYTKLHGSLDWKLSNNNEIIKYSLPFGAEKNFVTIPKDPFDRSIIYPNSYKDIDTSFFPYSELFRDFSSATCRPNSVLVIYGYGFGDSHINRIIKDMLTIPSTHIVIISFDTASDRITKFVEENNKAQFTLLIGSHFGNFQILVDNYLPKAAIDRITIREAIIRENRPKEATEINSTTEVETDE